MLGAAGVARRDVHAALRGDPPGPAGARAGPGRRAARRRDPRAAPGHRRSARARSSPPHGTVRADVVVRATEGYTARLPGQRRALAPVYSLMVATEPLPDERLGRDRPRRPARRSPTHRHLIIYGQRTADGRLAFGGRGAPYHFGSAVRPEHDRDDRRLRRRCARRCATCFPALARRRGSPTPGAARSASPATGARSVGLDRGDRARPGPAATSATASRTTNLAGRTLADLILGRDTELTGCPGSSTGRAAGSRSRCAGSGVNAGLRAMTARRRARSGSPGGPAGSPRRWPRCSATDGRRLAVTGRGAQRRGAARRAPPGPRSSRARGVLAVGDLAHRLAQDLARPGLRQRRDDRDVLERRDRPDLVAHLARPARRASSSGSSSTPALSTTKPRGTWPFSASATPITAHSATAGCAASTASIEPVDSRWPATLMTSSVRPMTNR